MGANSDTDCRNRGNDVVAGMSRRSNIIVVTLLTEVADKYAGSEYSGAIWREFDDLQMINLAPVDWLTERQFKDVFESAQQRNRPQQKKTSTKGARQ